MPYDWTHHHVLFGGAKAQGAAASALITDARYWHHVLRKSAAAQAKAPTKSTKNKQKVDWSVNLGGSGAFLAAGTFPAKYTFDINATPDCTNDFVVYGLKVAGSASQATIVAFNNLYTGTPAGICSGTAPTVLWAYNTGGAINTSPVLSLNGKKVAWISNANPPVLHVLTIGTTGSNGTAANSPATPGSGNDAVDTTVSYGTVGNTRSSLFVDYSNDVGYAASDDGQIHKFSGIFYGTPAEVTTGGWPITGIGGTNRKLTSIVFDSVSKNLFYGDDIGNFAYIREVGSTTGVCIPTGAVPPCLGQVNYALGGNARPMVDSPIIDSTLQKVFAFIGNNNSGHALVQQTDTQLSVGGKQAFIGQSGGGLFAGTFDNNYYNSVQTGFLYVCGYPALAAVSNPVLYRIGFNSSGVMNTSSDGNKITLSTSAGGTQCAPLTEIYNPNTATDLLFTSVGTSCAAPGGGVGGCIMAFDVTTNFPLGATARPASGGTSGIVVDNVSTSSQAASVYFSTQSNSTCGDSVAGTGCAVKMTQSGLN